MSDLTQFVIFTIMTDPTSSSLAKVFMEQVVLSYRMVAVFIVDIDSKSHDTLFTMYILHYGHSLVTIIKVLMLSSITVFWKGHKSPDVKITTHTILTNIKASQYAWNSALLVAYVTFPTILPSPPLSFKFLLKNVTFFINVVKIKVKQNQHSKLAMWWKAILLSLPIPSTAVSRNILSNQRHIYHDEGSRLKLFWSETI